MWYADKDILSQPTIQERGSAMIECYNGACPECGGDLTVTSTDPESAILGVAQCSGCEKQFGRIARHTLETQITDAAWHLMEEDEYGDYTDEAEQMLFEVLFHNLREEMRVQMNQNEFEEWEQSVLGDNDQDQEPFFLAAG